MLQGLVTGTLSHSWRSQSTNDRKNTAELQQQTGGNRITVYLYKMTECLKLYQTVYCNNIIWVSGTDTDN